MPPKGQQSRSKTVINHKFLSCRDNVLAGGTGGTPGMGTLAITTNVSGSASGSFPLCPVGLTGVRVISGAPTVGATGNIAAPNLRGLYNRAIDFQMYRVTRAKLVFVGAIGSTAAGILTLSGYTSAIDVSLLTTQAQITGPNTRVFDLANSSSRELSVPIPVDSAWKKVSSILSTVGVSVPFYGTNDTIVPVSNVDDVCFGGCSYLVSNAAVSTYVGTLYIDYDVEFKGVIDPSVNI